MLCHFHNRRVVKAIRYINHVETIFNNAFLDAARRFDLK